MVQRGGKRSRLGWLSEKRCNDRDSQSDSQCRVRASSASGAFHKNCLVTYVSGPAMLDEQHGMDGCRGGWNSGIPDGLALRTASSRWHQPQRQLPLLVATPAISRQANTQVGVTYQHSVSHAEEVKMIISHFFIVFFYSALPCSAQLFSRQQGCVPPILTTQ